MYSSKNPKKVSRIPQFSKISDFNNDKINKLFLDYQLAY